MRPVCISICLSIYICLSVCPSVYVHVVCVCLSVFHYSDFPLFSFSLELCRWSIEKWKFREEEHGRRKEVWSGRHEKRKEAEEVEETSVDHKRPSVQHRGRMKTLCHK